MRKNKEIIPFHICFHTKLKKKYKALAIITYKIKYYVCILMVGVFKICQKSHKTERLHNYPSKTIFSTLTKNSITPLYSFNVTSHSMSPLITRSLLTTIKNVCSFNNSFQFDPIMHAIETRQTQAYPHRISNI